MPVVGSSRMRTRAPSHSRRTISSCWRSPTVRSRAGVSGSRLNPYRSHNSRSSAAAALRSRRRPPGLPRTKLSITLNGRNTSGSWWSMPIPAAMASTGEASLIVWPSRTISPESAEWNPDSTFMRVDLPAPFSPRSPCRVPVSTVSVIPSLARTGPKCLWMSRSSRLIAVQAREIPPPLSNAKYERGGPCPPLSTGSLFAIRRC